MPDVNIEELMKPISEAEPCGENLEYDPEFAELERSAMGKQEQIMGDATIPGEPPDYRVVEKQALALFSRTKDLRVAAHLTRSQLDLRGFDGLAVGLKLISRMVADTWDKVHPQLDEEDDNDPIMRVSALSSLVAAPMLVAIRDTPLIRARINGIVSLRSFAIASGELPQPSDGTKVDDRSIDAAFREVDLETLTKLQKSLDDCRASLKDIASAFQKHSGTSGPDLTPCDRLLHQAQGQLKPKLGSRTASTSAATEAGTEAPQEGAAPGESAVPQQSSLNAEVRSREQVMHLLEKICDYYESYEPSSPLPLLLRRCQRLCNLSFKEIIQDMTPAGMKELDAIAGKEPAPAPAKK